MLIHWQLAASIWQSTAREILLSKWGIEMIRKKLLTTMLVVACLCLLTAPGFAAQSDFDDQGRPRFHQGMVTIKVVDGVGPFVEQKGTVSFGISSLDELVVQYSINNLEKRFRHRPIARDSGLPDLSTLYKLTFLDDLDVHAVAAAFDADPQIEFAEPIPIAYLAEIPNDALYDQLQHLPQIRASEAWDEHHGEDGAEPILIAVVDTGVDYNHPDLADNVWNNLGEDFDGDGHTLEWIFDHWVLDPGDINGIDDDSNGYVDDLIGWDFRNEFDSQDNDPADVYGHGTHVSGITAGVTNNSEGIASVSWNLKFMTSKHWEQDADDGLLHYDGIIYAAENGADIITNSWGYFVYSETDRLAIEYAIGLGSLVVAAAGNYDNNVEIKYPAAYPGVISVAALAVTDEKAYYSNYGMTVDVSAPGGDFPIDGGIISTIMGGSYEVNQGCSMATPMVAGLLGLVKSYHPEWTNEQMTIQVLGTADNIDDVNPDYENMLGSGRINAHRAMTQDEVSVAQQLRVDLVEKRVTDASGNGVLEPGEIIDIDFTLRNYAHFVGSDDASLILTSDDPDVIILAGEYTGSVLADDYLDLDDVFSIEIAADASPHIARLTLNLAADIEVLFGSEMEFTLLVAPAGILVYEGVADGKDYSGTYLRDLLQELGLPVFYTDEIPPTLEGFDAAFLSFGNWGAYLCCGTYPTDEETAAIIDYLEGGGSLYVEGGSFLYAYHHFDHPDANYMEELFGVESVTQLHQCVDGLVGQEGSLADGITFTDSEQERCHWINHFTLDSGAAAAFNETGIGDVAVQNIGSYGQYTFLFSYSLSDLIDVDPVSCRSNLVMRIVEFLELIPPDEYLLADFMPDVTGGPLPVTVQFTDLSHADAAAPITSWAWDFGNDDIVDSYDQNPQWTFTEPGYSPVRLVIGNGATSSTRILHDCVLGNDGILIWDADPGERDYSGEFIRNYLETSGFATVDYPVLHTARFPRSLTGFDAVFLSFGNRGSKSGMLTDARSDVLLDYLESNSRVYLEGGDPLGSNQSGNSALHEAFGLELVHNGGTHGIDELVGQEGSLAEGVVFHATDQVGLMSIDTLVPGFGGIPTFNLTGYSTVGVQYEGAADQKTVCFSYAMAELVDEEPPNTRTDLLQRLLSFFDPDIVDVEAEVPGAVALVGAHPNPFNPQTTIAYELPRRQHATVAVYDISGRRITVLADEVHQAGMHVVAWDGTDSAGQVVSSGTYLVRLWTQDAVESQKIMLLR